MLIRATNLLNTKLDLSALERLQEDNHFEQEPFRLIIGPGQQVEVDDKWYTLTNIQNSLKAGLIEILDYEQQNPFAQEITTAESVTNTYSLIKVEILNRADYPQDAFEKYNQNFDDLDTLLSSGNVGATTFTALTDTPSAYIGESGKAAVVKGDETGLEFTNVSGLVTSWGDITGSVPNQLDLQADLNDKVNVHNYTLATVVRDVNNAISDVVFNSGKTVTISRTGGLVSSVTDGTKTLTFARDSEDQIASWTVT